jgi:hypothetical protein
MGIIAVRPGAPVDDHSPEISLPLVITDGYGRRVGSYMVMVRRVRRHRTVAPGLGKAPAY